MTAMIEARLVRKKSNALEMTFLDGPEGAPMANAVQGVGEGKGAKLAVLLGFKNGGVGTHVLLDVIRTLAGWSLYNDLFWEFALSSYAQPLKLPMLGTRVALTRPLSELERDVVLGGCVDMAIGLRPYFGAMR